MQRKIVFATHNDHKIREVSQILDSKEWNILSLDDIGFYDKIVEDGKTLEENAWLKVRAIDRFTSINCIVADDTGLEVRALNNEPGVYSARYAGQQRSATDNMNKLLKELKPHSDRSARFRTVLACIIEGQEYTFEGIVNGHIAYDKSGEHGFGYDPIFVPRGYSESFGILSQGIKNRISHRARAFEQLRSFLHTMEERFID